MKQQTFASLSYQSKRKITRREKFLAEMEQVVPLYELVAVVEPHYPTSGRRGRPPMPLVSMLSIHFMQLVVRDERSSHGGCHDHPRPGLDEERQRLQRPRDAPDEEKGHQWYFGMKVHVGADLDSGVVHTVTVTSANTADISELPHLLREQDRVVFGDSGDVNDRLKRAARSAGVLWGVALKAKPKRKLGASQKRRNRRLSSIRCRVEHGFRVIKRRFGYTRVRYNCLLYTSPSPRDS